MEGYTISTVRDFMELVSPDEFEKIFNIYYKEDYDKWLAVDEEYPEYKGIPATIDSFVEFCWDAEVYESEIMETFLEERDDLWIIHYNDYAENYDLIRVVIPSAVDHNDLLFHVLKKRLQLL